MYIYINFIERIILIFITDIFYVKRTQAKSSPRTVAAINFNKWISRLVYGQP